MNLLVVQYVLPALLGYSLYVGIADRLSVRRPALLERRPAWLLGAGVGVSTSSVIATVLTLGTGMSLGAVHTLLAPAGLALAGLLSCVLIATSLYRHSLGTVETLVDTEAGIAADPVLDDTYADWVAPREFEIEPDVEQDLSMPHPLERLETADSTTPEAPSAPGILMQPDEHEQPQRDTQVAATEDPAQLLDAERALREQTEAHLRITRKALYVMQEESRQHDCRDDELLALEERLVDGVRETAIAEARAERESFARMASETTVSEQREDLLRVQRDLRRNVEARARALATANKALAHAKSSNRKRQRLVLELNEARATIDNRQETISSLIRALETEKGRTGDEVASLAKQLVLHERQLKARRSLEEVARSVEGKLTTRLVKKVAKARPVLPAH